jgi:hypothetical protein
MKEEVRIKTEGTEEIGGCNKESKIGITEEN